MEDVIKKTLSNDITKLIKRCRIKSMIPFIINEVNKYLDGVNGDEINLQDGSGNTLLMLILAHFPRNDKFNGRNILITRILETFPLLNLCIQDRGRNTLLIQACTVKDTWLVTKLLNSPLDNGIDLWSNLGNTALIMACMYNGEFNAEIIMALLKKGCNVNIQNVNGSTAILTFLNTHNISILNNKNAADIVMELIERSDLTLQDSAGTNVLMSILTNRLEHLAEKVIEKSDLTQRDNVRGRTGLMCACASCRWDIVIKILDRHDDTSIVEDDDLVNHLHDRKVTDYEGDKIMQIIVRVRNIIKKKLMEELADDKSIFKSVGDENIVDIVTDYII